ncbi:MAG: hypothetical protein WC093_09175 [Methanoculleus sp.]
MTAPAPGILYDRADYRPFADDAVDPDDPECMDDRDLSRIGLPAPVRRSP